MSTHIEQVQDTLVTGRYGERAYTLHDDDVEPGNADYPTADLTEFRTRFWLSVTLTLPILFLSPGLWGIFGLADPIVFPGDYFVLFALSSLVFFYGGWPFLTGLMQELRKGRPGINSVVAVAMTALYGYSSAVNFGMSGMEFYWELAIFVDIMLFGQLLGAE